MMELLMHCNIFENRACVVLWVNSTSFKHGFKTDLSYKLMQRIYAGADSGWVRPAYPSPHKFAKHDWGFYLSKIQDQYWNHSNKTNKTIK